MIDAMIAVELYAVVRQEKPSLYDGHGGIHWHDLDKPTFDQLVEWVKDAHILTLYVREDVFFEPTCCEIAILPRSDILHDVLTMLAA